MMGKYTAAELGSTWPRKVAKWICRELGSMPSRYQRSDVRTANDRRRSWSRGGEMPGGMDKLSFGKRLWNVWLIVPGLMQARFTKENRGH